jgi:hypothetical protein
MKITHRQLNELIRYITRGVLKEYDSMSSDNSQNPPDTPGSSDTENKPVDAMTSAEKSKADREQRQAKITQTQQAQRELDGTKAQDKYYAKQREVNRVSIRSQEKAIQTMKGARVSAPVSAPVSSPVSR